MHTYFTDLFDRQFSDIFQGSSRYLDFKEDRMHDFVRAHYDGYLYRVFAANKVRGAYGFELIEPLTVEEACTILA